MRFNPIRPRLWPFRLWARKRSVTGVAEYLIQAWGDSAFLLASTMSWRESCGLIDTPSPRYWSRVTQEIGLRFAQRDLMQDADHKVGDQALGA